MIDARRQQFSEDRQLWHFVIDTFWQMTPDELLAYAQRLGSFEALLAAAHRERDGMVAT